MKVKCFSIIESGTSSKQYAHKLFLIFSISEVEKKFNPEKWDNGDITKMVWKSYNDKLRAFEINYQKEQFKIIKKKTESYLEDRRRGHQKRMEKERKEIAKIGLDSYNKRMQEQKAEKSNKEYNEDDRDLPEFWEWLKSPEGKKYQMVKKTIDTNQI